MEIAGLIFYQRLFELDPGLRPLFGKNIETQAQKLMDKLATAIGWLEHPSLMERDLEELGARHVAYGAQRKHYATVVQALFDTFAMILGPSFTEEVRAAWKSLLTEIQMAMLRGAGAAKAETTPR